MAMTDAGTGGTIIAADLHPPLMATLVGACEKGDLLAYDSGWKKALATVGTALQAKAVAGADGKIGDVIPIHVGKVIVGGDRFSGCVAGAAVYSAEGTSNGHYTETAPSTTGDCNKIIGVSLSATEILVDCNMRPDTVA